MNNAGKPYLDFDMDAGAIQKELKILGNAETAAFLQGFFKTVAGEYGEGDLFRGIRVPALRNLAGKYRNLSLAETAKLLRSPFHEDRLLALFLLVQFFTKGGETSRKTIYDLYLANTRFVNNWDLVDASAAHIVGAFLWAKNRQPLELLARSDNLWERRIAIMATFYFIRREDFADTLRLAEILLSDKEDLMHKAVGWMLRETGKRSLEIECDFLRRHYRKMPRTMLRYAIEKFPAVERQKYLKGEI